MVNLKVLSRNVPDIINKINNSLGEDEITKYENILICYYASSLLILAAIANFLVRYIVYEEAFVNVTIDSAIFLVLGLSYEVLVIVKMKSELTSNLICVLSSLVFIFIVFRLYYFIGPAIWTVAFIQILLAMARLKRTMLFYMSTAIIISGLYVTFIYQNYTYNMGFTYSIIQTVLFAILFIISAAIHDINLSRYNRVNNQYREVYQQKEEITALYEEVAAAEEELREQNVILADSNITIKKNEEKLIFLANFDTLTELPNRRNITERIDLLVQLSIKKNLTFYVVFIDLDNFKYINDTLGHNYGDLFLQLISSRLKQIVHKGDYFGRIGGDEFALIIQRDFRESEALFYVEEIRKSLSEAFIIEEREIFSTASFGMAVFPIDGSNSLELLKCADIAMYKAKEIGKNNIQFFNKSMKEQIVKRIEMKNKLNNAIKKNEFFLVFQPQYILNGDKIRGFETLIRWNSPDFGIVAPMDFIPFAEETGLINQIGNWVLKTACKKFKEILDTYKIEALICVNISAEQIKDINFIENVKKVLEETQLKPEYLEIEITETIFIKSIEKAVCFLNELKNIGVKIALDDFGIGYSSLSYLKLLPIDTLKIDNSFVRDIAYNLKGKQIVGDIISLGHNLNISVIAEGVENEHQYKYLKETGCDWIQGFLMSKPLGEQELENFLTKISN